MSFLRLLLALGAMGIAASVSAQAPEEAPGWYDSVRSELRETWEQGRTDYYLPFRTYHLHFAYSQEKIHGYQEHPLGFGVGVGSLNEKGNWHGYYALAFQDSHSEPEYMLGYGWQKRWPVAGRLSLGLGYAAFLTSRADIAHYFPIPGAVPVAALEYRRYRWSLESAYMPGGKGFGNILFFWFKWHVADDGA